MGGNTWQVHPVALTTMFRGVVMEKVVLAESCLTMPFYIPLFGFGFLKLLLRILLRLAVINY